MAGTKTTKKTPQKSAKRATTTTKKSSSGFSAEERAAMRERAKELKASKTRAAGEKALLEKISEMGQPDRGMAERIHAIVTENAPDLWPKTWYGMPAYARDDKVLCFFQPAEKFGARYATFGFNDSAKLDKGGMWPTGFAIKELSAADEAKIASLVKKAVS
jgi:uncharacterized protein YdhG (YjbR/CyaY superfamily)